MLRIQVRVWNALVATVQEVMCHAAAAEVLLISCINKTYIFQVAAVSIITSVDVTSDLYFVYL